MSTLFIGESPLLQKSRIQPLQCVRTQELSLRELGDMFLNRRKFDRIVTFFSEEFLKNNSWVRIFLGDLPQPSESGQGKGFRLETKDLMVDIINPSNLRFEVLSIASAEEIAVTVNYVDHP